MKNRAFYACTIDGMCIVEVADNVAVKIKNSMRSVRGCHLCSTVFKGAKQEENLFRRLDRNDRYAEMKDLQVLVQLAKDIIKSCEKDFGVKFLVGDAAWQKRVEMFAV